MFDGCRLLRRTDGQKTLTKRTLGLMMANAHNEEEGVRMGQGEVPAWVNIGLFNPVSLILHSTFLVWFGDLSSVWKTARSRRIFDIPALLVTMKGLVILCIYATDKPYLTGFAVSVVLKALISISV